MRHFACSNRRSICRWPRHQHYPLRYGESFYHPPGSWSVILAPHAVPRRTTLQEVRPVRSTDKEGVVKRDTTTATAGIIFAAIWFTAAGALIAWLLVLATCRAAEPERNSKEAPYHDQPVTECPVEED